jgi:hypothetical protein
MGQLRYDQNKIIIQIEILKFYCRNGVWFPEEKRNLSVLHSVQTVSGSYSASYTIDTGPTVSGVKAARTCS